MRLLQRLLTPGDRHKELSPNSNQGFTLVEALVSMLLTATYLGITMNIMVAAAFLRAKATEYNEVYNWIQDDFEQVVSKAKSYESQALPYSTLCNPTNFSNGLTANFIADNNNGLGGENINLGNRSYGTQTFSLSRSASPENNYDPNRLMKIKYTITDTGKNKKIIEIDTKVILSSGFNCPYP